MNGNDRASWTLISRLLCQKILMLIKNSENVVRLSYISISLNSQIIKMHDRSDVKRKIKEQLFMNKK